MLRRSLLALIAAFWALLVAGPAIAQSNKTLRVAFIGESDPKKQLAIAEHVQRRIISEGVTMPLGQFLQPMARRKNVTGNIPSPVPVFWNVEKK